LKQPHICSDAELYDGLDRSNQIVAEAHLVGLRFIREFDKRELWKRDGCRNMGEWLAGRYGISLSEGLRRTRAAHALEELPLISNELEAGRLSLDKIEQLARFATPATEANLLRWARRATLSAVWKRADRETRAPVAEIQSAHIVRFLEWWTCDEVGSMSLQGQLPADEAALFTKAIDRLADKIARNPEEDGNLLSRRADALVALASGQIAADPDPDRATVVVHADVKTLVNGNAGAYVEGGPALHPDIAARLTCDSRIQMVLHGNDGNVMGIGETSRLVPPQMKRVVMDRDGGCTFPGCGTTRFVDAHHVIPWPKGPTRPDNLTIACRTHHNLVHKFGWHVRLDEHQHAGWSRPDGRIYDPRPRPQPKAQPSEVEVPPEPEPAGSEPVFNPWPRLELAGFA